MDIAQLQTKSLNELRTLAKQMEIPRGSTFKKDDLIVRLLRANAEKNGL